MATELKFSKPDRSSNWGFRVVGGADFQEPLVVVKVYENSLAEKAGLRVGDVIAKVDNTSTTSLTHTEAQKIIASAGLNFILGVKRGEPVPPHLLKNVGEEIETEKIVRDVQVSVVEEIIDKAEELADILGKEIFRDFGEHKSAANRKSEKKMVFSNATQTFMPTEEIYKHKKWSTFLMKPDRPELKSQSAVEKEENDKNPYKVVIKKQSRRKPYPKEKRVQFDQNIVEVEIESRNQESPDQPSPDVPASPDLDSYGYCDPDPDSLEETSPDKIGDYENDYMEDNNNEEDIQNYEEETDFDNQIRKDSLGLKYKPPSEIIIEDPNSEIAMTLEEQLRAVQKQLEALSQLPSSVQITLDAVSKQLASIVSSKEEDEEEAEMNGENKGEFSDSVEAQAEGNVDDGEDSIVGDELEVDEELEAIMGEEEEVEDGNEGERGQEENGDGDKINEEDLEEQRREEELLAKQEKEMAAPPKPTYRPIVLPGGRKWIDPDDVVPTRKPKMSDEAIMESIESNLEVIAGKRKGINFMKNTPPPKNLDHLQRSEVYRLVHGMEPPVKGITTRPEKVLPEQDYYEASRETP